MTEYHATRPSALQKTTVTSGLRTESRSLKAQRREQTNTHTGRLWWGAHARKSEGPRAPSHSVRLAAGSTRAGTQGRRCRGGGARLSSPKKQNTESEGTDSGGISGGQEPERGSRGSVYPPPRPTAGPRRRATRRISAEGGTTRRHILAPLRGTQCGKGERSRDTAQWGNPG